VVVFPGVQALDVVGPVEVFAAAGDLAASVGDPGYRIRVAASQARPVRTSSGLELGVDAALHRVRGAVDTLVVAGGDGTVGAVADEVLVGAVRRLAGPARRITSVCSGAFVLAEAGLLSGRRATTHWQVCELLARRHPDVEVESDAIYVRDGRLATSAGVTAGMDLALALVEEDLGPEVALAVARRLVLFLRRPGGQSQFSAQLAAGPAPDAGLRELQAFIAEHPDADLGVGALARRAAMSERTLARRFRDELGTTPARYVEAVRVEAARRRLEAGDEAVRAVARACGFGSEETLRRSFLRAVGVTPSDYRRRFRPGAA